MYNHVTLHLIRILLLIIAVGLQFSSVIFYYNLAQCFFFLFFFLLMSDKKSGIPSDVAMAKFPQLKKENTMKINGRNTFIILCQM